MKQTYSQIADAIDASLIRIKKNRIDRGAERADAANYIVGVLKSLLTAAVMDLNETDRKHILSTLEQI